MCCVHVELSIPGHRFQSLSGFLPGCDRQRGVSHIHKLSFDPSNLIILIPVDKKRKTATRQEKESCWLFQTEELLLIQAADDCDDERWEEDSGP